MCVSLLNILIAAIKLLQPATSIGNELFLLKQQLCQCLTLSLILC